MEVAGAMRRDIALSVLLCVGFASFALFSIALTRDSHSVAALWLANGLMSAGFVLLPLASAVGLGVACAAISLTINILTGAPLDAAPIFTSLNIFEAVLAALLIRRFIGVRPRINGLPALLRIAFCAIAPATGFAALLAGASLSYLGRPFDEITFNWFAAHALGMLITLPAVLLTVDRRGRREFVRSRWEEVLLYGAVAVLSLVAYMPSTFPTPILLTPVMVIAAFRLGPRGAALSAVMVAVISTLVVTLGPQQGVANLWTQTQRIHNLQFVIAAAFFTSLSVALILAEQGRVRRLLAMRTRAAKRAQTRAQAAGAAKGEFLATMSHEIRTPMNAILGFTQTLRRRQDLPEEARRQLELIHRAGGSLLAVVNDILDYSRLETSEVELALAPQAPRAVARHALEIIAPSAEAKGLEILLEDAGPTDTAVMLDDLRVRQILLNLLSNAVKFTAAGQVRLKITARDQGPDMLLRFEVQDTGVGIPRELMHRLFRRFSQADSSVSRAFGGSGLGLAICKGLVEAMGGVIGVRSQPGSGSAFWFEIVAEHAAAAPALPEPDSPEELGRVRVLLVDDHAMNRDLGATVLDLLGCDVTLASDGAEAVEAAREGGFDAILMDIHMPVMDGVEATRQIRSLEGEAGQVPIIAMSADVMPEMVERCRRAGMSDSLGKPIQIEALQATLARWTQTDPTGGQTPLSEVA
ncbi:MAG: histidine kinase [Phenylobacterium sp.]|jgi:signal transduction histidine kinase/ActR/RegA family two-component response regulator|nr:histidine kinase [Phenylobacterium sp.]|tara:strand:- start:11995 stop:14085 length:2091 start_codon:yes stop_codon:yes gene_type:complete